ncbi:MAG TPA: hypothetical protein VIU11_19760 [Nakamurella sp.]
MSGPATLRGATLACLLVVIELVGSPAGAATFTAPFAGADPVPPVSVLAVAQEAVAGAADQDVRQSVAVIERATGQVVADVDGDDRYNTESITKLFTAAYYLEQAQGAPDADLAADLSRLIAVSDNDVQFSLWQRDIVPTVAQRYGMTATTNAPNASEKNWGSDRTTANDLATFLVRAAQDPSVGPWLLTWMAMAEPTGADGFDQSFGVLALSGSRGAKQGWSDPGWSPANLHSVGWTDRYFIAILQSSDSAAYRTMRATSTHTAQLIGGQVAAASTPTSTAPPEPATTAPSSTSESVPVSPVDADPNPDAGAPAAIAALGQAILRAVAKSLLAAFGG